MAIYSIGIRTTGVVSTAPFWELRTGANPVKLRELGLTLGGTSATIYPIALGVPAARGVTPTTPVAFQAEDPGDPASLTFSALAWATPPTNPLIFLRRFTTIGSSFGSGIVWRFFDGLMIPANSSLVLAHVSATTTTWDVWAVIQE